MAQVPNELKNRRFFVHNGGKILSKVFAFTISSLFDLHRKLKVHKIFKSISRSKKMIYYDDIPKKV